jgi:hypothetical protein
MTMLAILCEQDEILNYILENKSPDLSVRVDGYTALHLAAMVKDYRPLKLLIQYQWVQENIDLAIELKGVKSERNDFTTDLHAAVSNNRIPQIFLLVSELPPYKKIPEPKAQHPQGTKKPTEPEPAPAEEESHTVYNPANLDQRSAVGSPVLYIATFLKNPIAVEILRAAGAEPDGKRMRKGGNINPAGGKIQKEEAEERGSKSGRTRGAKYREPNRSWRSRICQRRSLVLLTKDADEELDVLKQRYAPELVPKVAIEAPQDVDDDEVDETPVAASEKSGSVDVSKKKKNKSGKGSGEKVLTQILDAVKELSVRVGRLESGAAIARPGGDIAAGGGFCAGCGAGGASPCTTCHCVFCAPCDAKVDVHTGWA